MDIEQISERIDSEAIVQSGLFSHDAKEYAELCESIRGIDANSKEFQNLEKKAKGIEKPLAKFAKAVIDLIRDNKNDKAMMAIEEKAFKSGKYEHALTFAKIVAGFDSQNFYALDMICMALKRTGASVSEQKKAIENYLEQDLLDTHYLQELAKLHMDEGKKDNAIIDLKKAVQRAIKKNNPQELKVCSMLLDEIGEENDKRYLLNMLAKATKSIEKDKIISILGDLEKRNRDNPKYCILILKEILKSDPKSSRAKNSLIEQYRKHYGDSERCELCLKSSGLLSDSGTDTAQAISSFEKFVQIEKKAFVSHSTFGLGRIASVDSQQAIIDFIGKRGHRMSIEMANKSLTILDKGDIQVLKAFANKQKLKEKFASDPRWGLVTLIKSGDNTLKLMKSELVPQIMKANEFAKFQDAIKKIIKDDEYISATPSKSDEYEVRDTPITYEEKLYRQFRNESGIYGKMKIVRLFLQTEGDQASESFQNMMQHFMNFLKAREVSKNYVASFLFLQELSKSKYKISDLQNHIYHTEREVFASITAENKVEYYLDLQDVELKKDYADCIRKYDADWKSVLEDIYAKQPSAYITKIFSKEGDEGFEERMMRKSIFLSKQNPDLFAYFLKAYPDCKDWQKASLSELELISVQLDIIRSFAKSPSAKYVQQSLIDSGRLNDFLSRCDENSTLTVLYWAIDRNQNIEDMTKVRLKKTISDKVPDVEASDNAPGQADAIPKRLLCTQSSYDRKRKEYDNIINVEIPKNASDIAKARELGDLRENSEYQYAKDRQKFLASSVSAMEDEMAKASVVGQDDIDTSKVSFGCKITLENDNGTLSQFTIMGPWESNADENIISYSSPLGRKLYGHTSGERLEFDLNDIHYAFEIKNIESIDVS